MTKSLRKEDVTRDWWVIDASEQTVGRLSTQVAILLRGKHKATFTPHVDNGDFVVILNAEKIMLQGKRPEQKTYFRHSGYPGGVRLDTFKDVMNTKPERVLEHSIKGMLPKNRLGRQIIKKLKIYVGNEHPHEAQKPRNLELKYK
ncbi:MAG: 50S ribosomal protein L13 [Ignavibacteriae bacterium HGW-Ignavibacteriae-1]|jgi:large subunit ribosomal protein L13|nr:50S ribosomal protein L13 [Candidatus Kapabacteria bacterium]PKL86969.1 MAG: 50S ribosomal protein L13 [Ignavibacteriae bacterium HGW-Ignavibacteriae-1]